MKNKRILQPYTEAEKNIFGFKNATLGGDVTDENLLKNEVPTSIISPISYMSAGLIAYRAFFELVELDNVMPDALQLDLLNWQVIQYDLSK